VLKWSLAFSLYIGSLPCVQLPAYQDQFWQFIQPGWAECVFVCIFSLGLYFVYSFVFL